MQITKLSHENGFFVGLSLCLMYLDTHDQKCGASRIKFPVGFAAAKTLEIREKAPKECGGATGVGMYN